MNKCLILLIATLVLVACKSDGYDPFAGIVYDPFAFDAPYYREVSITSETNTIWIPAHLLENRYGEFQDSILIYKLKIVTEESSAQAGVHYTLPEPFELDFALGDKAQLFIELHPEKITSKINLTITRTELKGDNKKFLWYDTLRFQLIPVLPQP